MRDTALSDALYLQIYVPTYILYTEGRIPGAASLLCKVKGTYEKYICTNRTVKKVEGSNNLERIILGINDTGIDVNGLFVAVE